MSRAEALHKLTKENEQLKEEIAKLRLVSLAYAKAVVDSENMDARVLDTIKIGAYLQIAGEGAKNESRWEDVPIDMYVGAKTTTTDFYKDWNASVKVPNPKIPKLI